MKKTYLFGEISVEVNFSYGYIENHCHDYETILEPQMFITLNHEDIKAEAEISKTQPTEQNKGYLEFLALYRKFCDKAAFENIILMHGCAVATGGKAYIFTAPSGTGKTTHAKLWLECFSDKAFILNGDKPLIRVSDTPIVYGTPWDGKEHFSKNDSLPLGGIMLIERSQNNFVEPLSPNDALKTLLSQCYRPKDPDAMQNVLNGIIKLTQQTKFYKLGCNISKEAALLSYKTLTKEDINEA